MQCVDCFIKDFGVDEEHAGELSLDFILPDTLIQYMEEGADRADKQDIFYVMAEKTNTCIQVSDKYLPGSTERVVRISVQSFQHISNLGQAVDLLANQLHENITLYMCSPHNLFYVLQKPEHVVFQQQLDILFKSNREFQYCCYQ
ncbi:hypothetical protein MBANPS3_004172 [Mucor bainieri]